MQDSRTVGCTSPSLKALCVQDIGGYHQEPADYTAYLSGEHISHNHKRRIKKEEKTKVVTAVWGAEYIQFLTTPSILHQGDLKNWMNCTRMKEKRMNSSFSLTSFQCSNELNKFCPPSSSDYLCFLLSLFFFYGHNTLWAQTYI